MPTKQGTESPSAGAKPRWTGLGNDEPKWVMEAVAFNLAMQINEDNQEAALARIRDEVVIVRRSYAPRRILSEAQLRARRRNREA